jgi:protein-L-isoaspartate(D-aspartate) O-methyltransferase
MGGKIKSLIDSLVPAIGRPLGVKTFERENMLREIEQDVEYTRAQIGKSELSPEVMAAMEQVLRHEFVNPDHLDLAYANRPLPIGEGQTISQPYIVALMTDLLEPEPGDVMLEVGTGSGYQAAVLSRLVGRVYSLEVLSGLSRRAQSTLTRLGYDNVECRCANGYFGWPERAPFDGILVTAAAPNIPQPLVDQLKPGARLVIPVGLPGLHQELILLEKDEEGNTRTRDLIDVIFVPLTGDPLGKPSG